MFNPLPIRVAWRQQRVAGIYPALGFLCILQLFSATGKASAQELDATPQWGAHIDVEAKPGNRRKLGEIDIFAPLAQDAQTLYFANVRGRFDNHSSREGNLGLGVRRMLPSGWNLGAYGYLDRRRSDTGNYFNQTTLGAELLGQDWDLRANAYLPFGSKARSMGSTGGGASTASIVGSTVQITTPGSTAWEERALKGFDAEVGWRVPVFDSESSRQLRVYLGGYRFSDAGVKVQGPRARLELALHELPALGRGAALFLSAETQRDDARGRQSFVALRLRIPLGGAAQPRAQTLQQRRMTAPVVRDADIVSQRMATATTAAVVETATATADGQSFTVVNGANTSGAGLQTALNNAGNNSMVIVTGNFSTTSVLSLFQGQSLIGGGPLAVRAASGQTATLQLAGATINSVASNTVRMADSSTLAGLTINAETTSAAAIDAQARNNVTIRNNTITAYRSTGVIGVDLRTTSNAVFTGNTVTASTPASAGAITVQADSAANLTFSGNTLSANTANVFQHVIAINHWTSFASGSTGNVALNGSCHFDTNSGPAPGSGSVGFTNIACH
ncbi:MAG: inverse autotransporter beta domain-containing protein [Comamonas sp.]